MNGAVKNFLIVFKMFLLVLLLLLLFSLCYFCSEDWNVLLFLAALMTWVSLEAGATMVHSGGKIALRICRVFGIIVILAKSGYHRFRFC